MKKENNSKKKIKYKFELSPTQIKVLEQKGYKFKKQKL